MYPGKQRRSYFLSVDKLRNSPRASGTFELFKNHIIIHRRSGLVACVEQSVNVNPPIITAVTYSGADCLEALTNMQAARPESGLAVICVLCKTAAVRKNTGYP